MTARAAIIRRVFLCPFELNKKEIHLMRYVLVHDAWHGAWCWKKVVPLLERAGHEVVAPNLPGHGQDLTSLEFVTLEGYVQRILYHVETAPEPVILVGHALGGVVISQVAEERPDKIHLLVYLAALLPRDGESAIQLYARDQHSRMAQCLEIDEAAGVVHLYSGQAESVFYHDCSYTDILIAQEHLSPQALAPLLTPVRLSERFASVPRAAIMCEYDQVISLQMQAVMATLTPCDVKAAPLTSGHTPFFSVPDQLAECLIGLAAAAGNPQSDRGRADA